jgi:hypothetical protein
MRGVSISQFVRWRPNAELRVARNQRNGRRPKGNLTGGGKKCGANKNEYKEDFSGHQFKCSEREMAAHT